MIYRRPHTNIKMPRAQKHRPTSDGRTKRSKLHRSLYQQKVFEQQVSRHPDVKAALVAGRQRLGPCLLIEPEPTEALSDAGRAQVIERIWPVVEEANDQCPANARVSKSKILVVDAAKPMLRAEKGTVQRAGTIQLYRDEIDSLHGKQIQEPPKEL